MNSIIENLVVLKSAMSCEGTIRPYPMNDKEVIYCFATLRQDLLSVSDWLQLYVLHVTSTSQK